MTIRSGRCGRGAGFVRGDRVGARWVRSGSRAALGFVRRVGFVRRRWVRSARILLVPTLRVGMPAWPLRGREGRRRASQTAFRRRRRNERHRIVFANGPDRRWLRSAPWVSSEKLGFVRRAWILSARWLRPAQARLASSGSRLASFARSWLSSLVAPWLSVVRLALFGAAGLFSAPLGSFGAIGFVRRDRLRRDRLRSARSCFLFRVAIVRREGFTEFALSAQDC